MEEKHPGGRPTEFTEENKQKILQHLREGMSYTDAAVLSGVGKSTLAMWKKRGKDAIAEGKHNEFSEFLEQIDQAIIEYKKSLIDSVNTTMKKDGKVALDVLGRKWSDEWGKKDKLSITADVVNYDIKYTPEEEEECKKRFESFLLRGKEDV
jgi:transposase-like protein